MRLTLLALDGLFDSGLSVMLDAFGIANTAAQKMGARTRFEVSLVGVRKQVRSAQGLGVPVKPILPRQKADWIVVAALATTMPETLLPALARADVRAALAQLRAWHKQGARVAASCIGTFILAEAGLLDG